MNPLVTITPAELEAGPSARLWALVMYLAEHPEARSRTELRVFWLAYSYDAEVLNGGHLQYFHNRGTERVAETLASLHAIGAHHHAELLAGCWTRVKSDLMPRVRS